MLRNKNNICYCIENKVQMNFRQRIFIQRWKIKSVTYINHRYEVMKMKKI